MTPRNNGSNNNPINHKYLELLICGAGSWFHEGNYSVGWAAALKRMARRFLPKRLLGLTRLVALMALGVGGRAGIHTVAFATIVPSA